MLLRKCADQTGLTGALSGALRVRGRSPGWDRDVVLVQLAVAIVLGATSMADIALLKQQAPVFGEPASDSTVRRALVELDAKALSRIRRARRRVRAHVWDLIAARSCGFAGVSVAGQVLTGSIVVDIDATLITAHSDEDGAAATFKKGWGFQCAMRRLGVSPVQPGGTWKEVPGPDDLPDPETVTGPEHVRKLAAVPRRCGRCARGPRDMASLTAWAPISSGDNRGLHRHRV
jgi:hypothetical protein